MEARLTAASGAAACLSRRGFVKLLLLATLLALGSLFALAGDLAVTRYLTDHPPRGDVRRLIALCETFGYGITVAIIWLAAWLLDPAGRKRWSWTALGVLLAGIVANVAKFCVPRWRPREILELVARTGREVPSVFDTFAADRWEFTSAVQSFPSGHAALAAASAVGLSLLYPRGRSLFATLAVLACFQRISAQAHFLSDVLAGASMGTMMLAITVYVAARYRTAENPAIAGTIRSADEMLPQPDKKAS